MISFICSAYNRPTNLKLLAYSLMVQTNPKWELLVMDESEERINDITNLDKRIRYFPCDRYNDFGYSVKELGIHFASGKYLCFPADDVFYAQVFVEQMSKKLQQYDLVYCNWIHDKENYKAISVSPSVGSIDVGGFVVKKELMKDGFQDKSSLGDGVLVEKLVKECSHTVIESYLYVKN